jgi:hypothetical protein
MLRTRRGALPPLFRFFGIRRARVRRDQPQIKATIEFARCAPQPATESSPRSPWSDAMS